MPNKKTVGWGEERTPTNAGAGANVGVPASPQPTSAIPGSWVSITLGEAIDYGKTIKAEPLQISDNTWVLELEDIEKNSSKVLQRMTFVDRKSKSTKNYFQTGDVLYGKLRPYLNKVVIADTDGVCSTEIIPLSSSEYLDNRYLYYWLKHPEFLAYVTKVGYGVNMPRLSTKDGKAAPFVLAPLAEQKQIAAKLDELLAQVDSIKTRLDAIPAILKRFRQSVLAAAVSGRLTNVDNFTEIVRIDDVGKVIGGLTKNQKRNSFSEKRPYLRVANVYENGIRTDSVTEIGIQEKELDRILLKFGGILVVEGNGSLDQIGRVAIWRDEIKSCVHQNHLIKIRVDKEKVLPIFALYYLMSPQGKAQIIERATSGAGLYTLSISKVSSITIPYISTDTQTEIVRRVDQLFAFADQIEQRLKDARSRVNHLTQSILAKAFRGELTAEWREQNPDSINGKNSAEVLLGKIKSERECVPPTKRTRRKKAEEAIS